jgi:iron complex transport system substrate-binding protein
MVTQFGAGRTPAGLRQKADDLNIRLINVSITRLDDIYAAMTTLADAIGETERGDAASEALRSRIAAVANRSTGRAVATLIVLDDAARAVAGRGNYLDDVLSVAGGRNVVQAASPYPTIDRELLISLDPEVIVQLLPDATPQVRSAAGRVWQGLPQLRAVREGRVHVVVDPWSLSPTQHVAELAEVFEKALGEARETVPAATTQSTSSAGHSP